MPAGRDHLFRRTGGNPDAYVRRMLVNESRRPARPVTYQVTRVSLSQLVSGGR